MPNPLQSFAEIKARSSDQRGVVTVAKCGSSSAINMPPTPKKHGTDILFCDAKNGGQFTVSSPAKVKRMGAVNVEGRRDMCSMVFGSIKDSEVFDPVIGAIAVDMVDVFGGQQPPPEMLFHEMPMFIDLFAIEADHSIAGSVEAMHKVAL